MARQIAPGAAAGSDNLWNRILHSPIVHKSRRAVSNVSFVSKKLMFSTGKAAWIAGTTLLLLAVPLIIEIDKEQQLAELESQQATLLGGAPQQTL